MLIIIILLRWIIQALHVLCSINIAKKLLLASETSQKEKESSLLKDLRIIPPEYLQAAEKTPVSFRRV